MAGTYKPSRNGFEGLRIEWDARLKDLGKAIHASSQAYVPVSQHFEGPHITQGQLNKLQQRKHADHKSTHKPGTLKRSGRVIADEGSVTVIYTAPYAIYPEVGTSRQTGQHYLLKGLHDHREEIENGSFLKGDD